MSNNKFYPNVLNTAPCEDVLPSVAEKFIVETLTSEKSYEIRRGYISFPTRFVYVVLVNCHFLFHIIMV